MWGSKDVEVENGAHPYVKPEVRVEAQDTQTKQNIEKELMQELKNRNGTRYTFDNQTRLFTMTFPDGRKGYEGTYKCKSRLTHHANPKYNKKIWIRSELQKQIPNYTRRQNRRILPTLP